MQTHERSHDGGSAPKSPVEPRGGAAPAGRDPAALEAKIDALTAHVAYLVERQRKQEELFAEMTPILREVMGAATTRLDDLEKHGYFAFGREVVSVAQRIVESYDAADVRAFGDAIVSILDTVRALTQPEVLAVVGEAGKVLQKADEAQPLGLVGMVRATGNENVQKGMAVMMDVLRHVGAAAKTMAERRAASPEQGRRDKLAATLGPRRKKALGSERAPAPAAARPRAARPVGPPPACAVPGKPAEVAAVIDGVAFTADGHLADPKAWTPDLGKSIAATLGVTLGEQHWSVVQFARGDFEQNGVSPNIRRITQATGLSTKDLYALFPKAPARTVAKVAGIPKPAGCL